MRVLEYGGGPSGHGVALGGGGSSEPSGPSASADESHGSFTLQGAGYDNGVNTFSAANGNLTLCRPAANASKVALVLVALALTACGNGGSGTPSAPVTPGPVTPGTPTPTPEGGVAVVVRGTPIAQDGPAALTIRYVERLPTLEYVPRSSKPAVDGWPAPGSMVTWRAHLRNWTAAALRGVEVSWFLDGQRAASEAVDMDPNGEGTSDFHWTWERSRHEITLEVDAGHRFTIPAGRLNRLLTYSDALSVGFYVERGLYDHFRAHQHELRLGRSSFDDWAQEQFRFFNEMLAAARYPETPQGVLDRLRLDRITVVPDGSLPLQGGVTGAPYEAESVPNPADLTVDLQWGFPSRLKGSTAYTDFRSLEPSNGFYYSGSVQHELGHARYLMDIYSFDVFHGINGSRIEIQERGQLVAGSAFMPGQPVFTSSGQGLRVHETPFSGLMNKTWTYLDRPSAAALNLIAGRRAVAGNYNEPENIAVFLNDLPRENRLTLRDAQGRALAGARVQVYRSIPGDVETYDYAKIFDDRPDLEREADREGRVLLGRNPFDDGPLDTARYSNGVAILRVEHEGRVGYVFLAAAELNLEYWRGHTAVGDYDKTVNLL